MKDNITSLAKTASYYLLNRHFSVLPIKPKSKQPGVSSWTSYQTKPMSEAECVKLFSDTSNIAIICGKVSGIIVIDLDDKALMEILFPDGFPNTPIAVTARGFHLYFAYETGFSNALNFGGIIGFDLKSDAGYVIAPPSVHPSGFIYTWVEGHSIEDVPLAPLPALVKVKLQFEKTPIAELEKGGLGAGARNAALVRLVGKWFKVMAVLSFDIVLAKAMQWNLKNKPPLSEGEVSTTTKSIYERELKKRQLEDNVEWGTPVELPMKIPPVLALTPDMIPVGFRAWIVDAAERMQVAIDGIAVSAIVTAGSLIGRACGIFPKQFDDWFVVSNIWGGFIAEPGQKKSPAIAEGQFALRILASEADKEYQLASEKHDCELFIHKTMADFKKATVKKQINKGVLLDSSDLLSSISVGDLKKPTLKRYSTQDGTIEKIGELLQENPQGFLIARDELIGWLQSLEKAGREGDRAFYLEAWNGTDSYTIDRIGRGTFTIPGMCLSIFGGITPSRLRQYVYDVIGNGAGNDGLLQRFQLLIWPDQLQSYEHIDRLPDKTALQRALKIFKWLGMVQQKLDLDCHQQTKNEIPGIHLSEPAQVLFNNWITDLEVRLRSSELAGTPLEAHLSKYRSLMPSLALIFHVIDIADGLCFGEVSENAVRQGVDWCVYLESHANRIYSLNELPEMLSASVLLDHIRKGDVKDGCSPRDIYRNEWRCLKTHVETKAALKLLDEYGWVSFQTGHNGQGVVRLHPDLG